MLFPNQLHFQSPTQQLVSASPFESYYNNDHSYTVCTAAKMQPSSVNSKQDLSVTDWNKILNDILSDDLTESPSQMVKEATKSQLG